MKSKQCELLDVNDDGRCLERCEPTPALERESDLSDALRRGRFERGEGRLAQHSVGGKPVTQLIVAHAGTQARIESRICQCCRVAGSQITERTHIPEHSL